MPDPELAAIAKALYEELLEDEAELELEVAAAALASTAVPDALSALSEAAEESSAAETSVLAASVGVTAYSEGAISAAGGFDGNLPAGGQDAVAEGVVEGAAVGLGGSVSAAPYTGLENVTTSGTSSLQLGFGVSVGNSDTPSGRIYFANLTVDEDGNVVAPPGGPMTTIPEVTIIGNPLAQSPSQQVAQLAPDQPEQLNIAIQQAVGPVDPNSINAGPPESISDVLSGTDWTSSPAADASADHRRLRRCPLIRRLPNQRLHITHGLPTRRPGTPDPLQLDLWKRPSGMG